MLAPSATAAAPAGAIGDVAVRIFIEELPVELQLSEIDALPDEADKSPVSGESVPDAPDAVESKGE